MVIGKPHKKVSSLEVRPLRWRGGGEALLVGPLTEELLFADSLSRLHCIVLVRWLIRIPWARVKNKVSVGAIKS